MSVTTTTTLVSGGANSYLAAEYLIARIGEEAAQRSNMPESMWVEYLVGTSTLSGHFRFVNTLSASAQTEGNALGVVTWNPTGVVITAGLDGLAVQVSKLVDSISPEVLGKVAQQGGTALARAIDTSACALFPSLTAGTVGSTGTALTVTHILTANANLDANHADEISGYQGRVHPQAFLDLQKDALSKNFGIAKISVDAQNKDVITIGDTRIYKNTLVPVINSNADYAGAVYCNEALGLVIAQSPTVEILAIPGQSTWSIDCTVAFGVGVVRPTLGALLQSGISA